MQNQLRECRRHAGLTQAEVAAEAACSPSSVAMAEAGYVGSVDLRSRMAEAVGRTFEDVFPQPEPVTTAE